MAYRTGTYFGFDGLGNTDPSQSDFKYYATVQSWAASKNIDFQFVNSHEKASAVRDTSKRATLESSIRNRLSVSKQMVIILSTDTRSTGSMLSYEIEKAIDLYNLPLILSYTGVDSMLSPGNYSHRWPTSLKSRLQSNKAKAIHIPFKKNALLDAISQFSVNGKQLNSSMETYSRAAQQKWGYLN